jgi:hypothetical protein
LQIEPQALDPRLLWSTAQQELSTTYQRLLRKYEAVEISRGCIFVTTGEVIEHWVAAFNLAMTHSFDASTLLIDATAGARIQSDLLKLPVEEGAVSGLVSKQFMLTSLSAQSLFATQWPSMVNGVVGDHMFALVQTKDVFKLDWVSTLKNCTVIALTAPNELEEERWQRLA